MSEKKKATGMATDVADIKELQGYGEILKVFAGNDKNGDPIVREFHIAPVPMRQIPELVDKIEKFQTAVQKAAGDGQTLHLKEKDIMLGAETILLGLQRTAPDITADDIADTFTLGTVMKAVRLLIGVNNLPMATMDEEGNFVPFGKVRRAPKNG